MNIKEILKDHKEWIESNREKGKKADLSGANLSDANLTGANLFSANLFSADLRYADLSGADLRYADLRDANLTGADLISANLRAANLSGADLLRANLLRADLNGANLRAANLSGADLTGANLSGADLRYCIGNNKEIKSFQFGTYLITTYKNIINVGCKEHTIEEWLGFSNEEINEMDGEALTFYHKTLKPFLHFYKTTLLNLY